MIKLIVHALFIAMISFHVNAQIEKNDQIKIDNLFSKWDNENSPGAAIGIIKEGKLIYAKGYGIGNLDYTIPLSANSKFYIASTAKQFTAACIALLTIEGKIRLDDEIQKHIPELPKYDEKITVRNLVHHTSGIRDYLELMYLRGSSFEDYFTIDDGLKLILRQNTTNFKPGEEYLYSNSGYILMAEIVNRVSGMTIREYADKNIFQPLGMTNTFFNDDHSQITKNRVISYQKQSDTLKRFVQNFDAHGDGNLITTIKDMYLWDQNFYHHKVGGKVLNNLISTRGILNNGDTIHYSFGLSHGRYKGMKTVYHGGGFLGFRTQFVRFPEQNFSVIVFANTPDVNPTAKVYSIVDIIFEDKLQNSSKENEITETVKYVKIPSKKLKKFAAMYWNKEGQNSRKIYVENDTLRYQRSEDSESKLLPISKNEFIMSNFPNVKVKFNLKEDKKYGMIVTLDDGTLIESSAYEPAIITSIYLDSFAGSYYSSDLDCVYEFRIRDEALFLYRNGDGLGKLNPVMKDVFTNDNIGTFKFNGINKSEFSISSERVNGIKFIRQ